MHVMPQYRTEAQARFRLNPAQISLPQEEIHHFAIVDVGFFTGLSKGQSHGGDCWLFPSSIASHHLD